MENKTPKTLTNLVMKHPNKVDYIGDERGSNNGYWIYLKPGWTADVGGAHHVHEFSVKECMSYFRGVVPCDCEQCEYELKVDD